MADAVEKVRSTRPGRNDRIKAENILNLEASVRSRDAVV
jgi:hypothetical protein